MNCFVILVKLLIVFDLSKNWWKIMIIHTKNKSPNLKLDMFITIINKKLSISTRKLIIKNFISQNHILLPTTSKNSLRQI